jgi:hypothetical protein
VRKLQQTVTTERSSASGFATKTTRATRARGQPEDGVGVVGWLAHRWREEHTREEESLRWQCLLTGSSIKMSWRHSLESDGVEAVDGG